MRLPHNSNNLVYVRSLRKNVTDAERKLWYEYLRPCPYKFTRQKSVGPYILDFYCASALLAVEIDGSQLTNRRGSSRMLPELLICRRLVFLFCGFLTGTFFSIWRVLQPKLSVRF